MVFHRALASSVRVKDGRYPYVKGCTPGASEKFSWEQLVTYLVHSVERFKTRVHGRSSYPSNYLPLLLGDALGLRVTRRGRNKLINGHIERGGRKFQ